MINPQNLLEALSYIEGLLNNGKIGQAISLCEQLLVSHPKEKELQLLYAIALQIRGDRKESLQILQELLQEHTQSSEVWNHYALVLFEEHFFTEAQKALQSALNLDPSNAFSWWLKSIFRTFQHDDFGSERAYLYARWLEPESYPPYPIFSETELLDIFQRIREDLVEEHQNLCSMLIWTIQEIPSMKQLKQLETSPIIPLLQIESTQMTVYIFRKNIQRLGLEGESIEAILRDELMMALENSHFSTVLA